MEVALAKEPKKMVKGKKRERGGIPLPFTVSTEELYSILKAWVKDRVVALLECKHEPTEEEKGNPLYCRCHRRCDHDTMVLLCFEEYFP